MILERLEVPKEEFERATGWALKPQGACKGDVCIPLGEIATDPVDVRALADRLQMPLVHDEALGLWALGPEAGGRALTSVEVPDVVLPDRHGKAFDLSSLRGQKVLLLAWASW